MSESVASNNLSLMPKSRSAIRQHIREQRQQLTSQQQDHFATQLLQHFITDPKILQATHIAIYLTNDGELNTEVLIAWCWQQGKQVYLPVLHPFAKGHLLFLHYEQQTTLVKNQYGIAEPKLDARSIIPVNQLDIICTPLVAFDKSGARLGMGGGFYDRTLADWYITYESKQLTKPYPIGLAHNCQLVETLPAQQWDIPLPEIITPAKHYKFD